MNSHVKLMYKSGETKTITIPDTYQYELIFRDSLGEYTDGYLVMREKLPISQWDTELSKLLNTILAKLFMTVTDPNLEIMEVYGDDQLQFKFNPLEHYITYAIEVDMSSGIKSIHHKLQFKRRIES